MKLYHYDHCPYCAKARMIFGLKNIPVELQALPNDDEKTPTDLIGSKMVPILIKEDGSAMPESLDIIKYIDENYGGAPIVTYDNPLPEIATWLKDARAFMYHLAMPRWVQMNLPEFETDSARRYFQNKKEKQSIGSFADAFAKTEHYKEMAEQALIQLEDLMLDSFGPYDNQGGKFHIDNFHIFTTLRSLTTVKDLKWPLKIENYILEVSEKSKVNLYTDLAI